MASFMPAELQSHCKHTIVISTYCFSDKNIESLEEHYYLQKQPRNDRRNKDFDYDDIVTTSSDISDNDGPYKYTGIYTVCIISVYPQAFSC